MYVTGLDGTAEAVPSRSLPFANVPFRHLRFGSVLFTGPILEVGLLPQRPIGCADKAGLVIQHCQP